MQKKISKINVLVVVLGLLMPAILVAQKEDKKNEKKDVRQIIVTTKDNGGEKMVIEVIGDKVTVNGKPVDDYKDGDVKVKVNKVKDMESLYFKRMPGNSVYEFDRRGNNSGKGLQFFSGDENRAMLGVTTNKTEKGVEIQSVTKESAAEKAGLKENDIITKINDTKIEEPDDLSAAIKELKPGDKVTVTYLRDKKEQKAKAELTKWKGVNMWSVGDGRNFDFNFDKLQMDKIIPDMNRVRGLRSDALGQYMIWSGGNPKLGLSVQDTDNGKGVNVIEVEEESNAAKAGIKEEDVITEVDGKAVNSTDDIVKVIKESKDKNSVMVKLNRGGKTMNIDVKIPRKLKKADL